MEVTAYIATSLDGFIARSTGAVDWLEPLSESDDDYGFAEFLASVDAMVMGRNTYDMVQSFGGAWPYGQKPIFVLTSRLLTVPTDLRDRIQAVSCSPQDLVEQLSRDGFKHVYVDGGKLIQSFVAANLLHRIIVSRVPIVIGDGIPLWGPCEKDFRLTHVATQSFPSGLVQSEYVIGA